MVGRIGTTFAVVIFLLVVTEVHVFAQPAGGDSVASPGSGTEGAKAAQPEEMVKKGVVASYGRHRQAAAVDAADTPASGDEQSAVSGSVSRQKNNCIAKLTNNGKNSYSISFAVKGTSPRGTQTFRRVYSASLKPGGSVTREMRCQKDDNVEIDILSGRKTSK